MDLRGAIRQKTLDVNVCHATTHGIRRQSCGRARQGLNGHRAAPWRKRRSAQRRARMPLGMRSEARVSDAHARDRTAIEPLPGGSDVPDQGAHVRD